MAAAPEMTIAELRQAIADYPDDQFVHLRVWIGALIHVDTILVKVQQGVSGAALLTGDVTDPLSQAQRQASEAPR